MREFTSNSLTEYSLSFQKDRSYLGNDRKNERICQQFVTRKIRENESKEKNERISK